MMNDKFRVLFYAIGALTPLHEEIVFFTFALRPLSHFLIATQALKAKLWSYVLILSWPCIFVYHLWLICCIGFCHFL